MIETKKASAGSTTASLAMRMRQRIGRKAPAPVAPERDEQEQRRSAADRDDDGCERPLLHQQWRQFHDLARIEEVGRIERIAEIERFLVADCREQQRERGNEQDAVVSPPEQRVETDQQQREKDHRRPAGPERLLEEVERLLQRAAGDEFDQKDQDAESSDRDRKRSGAFERPPLAPALPAPGCRVFIAAGDMAAFCFANSTSSMRHKTVIYLSWFLHKKPALCRK